MAENRMTITVEQAAERLGISRPLAYRLAKSGKIPTIRLGERRILVPICALQKMLENAGSKIWEVR